MLGSNRAMRRIARASRVARAKYGNCAHNAKHRLHNEQPRKANILCKNCFGMSSARTPGRANDRSGGFSGPTDVVAYPPGLGVPGHHIPVCRGCGLEYGEDDAPERDTLLRSSGGSALDHGRLYGDH